MESILDGDDVYGVDEAFISPPPDVYECPICLLVANQPMQTSCGHRFCKSCIMKVVRGSRPNCPIDNQEINERNIFPDNSARKEIARLKVRCRNNQNHGCEWIGDLKSLNEHLNECEYALMSCSNNCGARLSRAMMNEHLLNTCDKRVVSCQYCEVKVVFRLLDGHYDNCTRFPVDCPNTCGKIRREELNNHLQKYCPKSIVTCSFRKLGCLFEGNRDSMELHNNTSKEIHFEIMVNAMGKLTSEHDQQRNNLDHKQCHLEFDRLHNRILALELLVDSSNNNNIALLEEKVEQVSRKTISNEKDIQEIKARAWNGSIIWKINNFKELFTQAEQGTMPAIYSHPFYTAVPGYKMCCRINLQGVDNGEGTHVSIFVHLMLGEYDNIIQWPFQGEVCLSILDQSPPGRANHVMERLTSNSSLNAFRQPTTSRNHRGYGYATMISHLDLNTHHYIKDDCIYVKVDVNSR